MENQKIQFINVYSQEIIREEDVKKEIAEKIISDMSNPPKDAIGNMVLMGSQMKIYQAQYITHKKVIEDGLAVTKLLFKLNQHEKQLRTNR